METEHIVHADKSNPLQTDITPERAGWKMLGFQVRALGAGETFSAQSEGNEQCLVFLGGDASVKVGGETWLIRGRRGVFAGLPHSGYLPPDVAYSVQAEGGLELAVGSAPAKGKLPPRLITPEDVKVEMRGGHNVTRQITHILDPGDAEHLLCVEVYTPSGNWSSYPPHKHDVQNPPDEVDLEEVYYYQMQPEDGWAMQRLYTDDRCLDERLLVGDSDAVLVREGYHPVVAAPGYDAYYLNFLAGETPSWVAKDEPQLAWVRGTWEGSGDRLKPLCGAQEGKNYDRSSKTAKGEFTERMVADTRSRRVGYGLDDGVAMGPVISLESKTRIESLVDAGVQGGAEVLVDGRGKEVDGFKDGYFLHPTVVGNVAPGGEFAHTEIFGPVLSMMHAATVEEAIEIVNARKFGNQACLFTSSGAAARQFRYSVRAGNVGINLGVAAPMAFFPFSGWGESFFGDLHAQGRHGVEFYTETKVVVERWPKEWSRTF